ncbi:amino acid ABC transporter ATP-binding protein [Labrys monachus]|uniref:Polar amino acid transport system ATP-binding protein n=1 Tax=Labrys monachus TaxID=217067 RepID=A0ABU0FEQ7_9HYPH|nr:amino acid ABC transporter ATP-binding protein [Labrys monachus]MDQ0392807.1 polar amino acid transport system ATP-binding protein [Labrys monachus]
MVDDEDMIRRKGTAVVRIDGVGKAYDAAPVLSAIDLTVHRGETVAIIGPSGSGKTTLLRCINFLVPYDSGRIEINGELIGYREAGGRLLRDKDANVCRIRKRIGMVFQRYALFPHRTVLGNLLEGPVHVLRIPREQAVARAQAALALVGLAGKADAYPSELSGGQQQRVGIARALCMEPDLLLFDEVTSALDPELVGEVLAVMRDLAERGRTMIVVTHEIAFARDVADRVVFMEDGRIAADLPKETFFSNPPSERIAGFIRRSEGRMGRERPAVADAGATP